MSYESEINELTEITQMVQDLENRIFGGNLKLNEGGTARAAIEKLDQVLTNVRANVLEPTIEELESDFEYERNEPDENDEHSTMNHQQQGL